MPPDHVAAVAVIREAVAADVPAILRLYQQLSPQGPAIDEGLAAIRFGEVAADPHVALLVAEVAGGVAGTVTLVTVPNLTHGGRPWAQIENMVVDEAARGSGVGRALLEACRERAAAADAYKIQLQSADHREGAHRFYEAYGFVASSRGYRLYLE